jgi:hypothetical protein
MWRDAYQSEDPKLREFAAGFRGVPMIKKSVTRHETRTHYHEYASDGAVPDLVDVFGAP